MFSSSFTTCIWRNRIFIYSKFYVYVPEFLCRSPRHLATTAGLTSFSSEENSHDQSKYRQVWLFRMFIYFMIDHCIAPSLSFSLSNAFIYWFCILLMRVFIFIWLKMRMNVVSPASCVGGWSIQIGKNIFSAIIFNVKGF